MWIKSIIFENWRVYKNAKIEIGKEGNRQRRVVLIGAENGGGKTSLLEGVTLCLYGKKGIRHLGKSKATKSYAKFIQEAFCRTAETSKSSVQVIFEKEDKTELSVKRVWHFDENRRFRESEKSEELSVSEIIEVVLESGEKEKQEKPIPLPPLAEESRNDYLARHIAENVLHPSLSPFFLFDGVQVQDLAQRHQKDQVKEGIEGILGVPMVKLLIENLHGYATTRRNQGRNGLMPDEKLDALRKEIDDLEEKHKKIEGDLNRLRDLSSTANDELTVLIKEFSDMDGDNVAQLENLREKLGALQKEKQYLHKKMADLLFGDFAVLFVGADLMQRTDLRLCQEEKLQSWEHEKTLGEDKYQKFLGNLEENKALDLPEFNEEKISTLRKKIKDAWDNVWYPAPEGCAESLLNADFLDNERSAAIAYLKKTAKLNMEEIANISLDMAKNDQERAELDRRIRSVRGDDTAKAKRLHKEILEKRATVERFNREIGDLERREIGVKNELAHKREEFGREMQRKKGANPSLHQSVQAESMARMCEALIEQSYSSHVKSVAEEMTEAYRSMAHKKDVHQITIDDDCTINLLDEAGESISDREIAPSHGESEIFALSLIAAISRVSQVRFPFIVDTPLANLDEKHRDDFLRHFSFTMDNQILFLSTNTEIRQEHMKIIRRRVAKKFLIQSGVGGSTVYPDTYFWSDDEEKQ